MISRILLATDGSEEAIRAADTAADLAMASGLSQVSVIYVDDPYSKPPLVLAGLLPLDAISEPAYDEVDFGAIRDDVLGRTVSRLEERGITAERISREGRPAEIIVKEAESGSFDMIVLGSRGYGAFRSMLLGSVSYSVLHHARCSVTIVS